MRTDQPVAIQLADYQPYPFEFDATRLDFDLHEDATIVKAEIDLVRKPGENGPLVLDGKGLELLEIAVDGKALDESAYTLDDDQLILTDVPDRCTLTTKARFSPAANKALSGLYMSAGRFCTQCEAEGFRHITFYPDRPDVMSKFRVRVAADRKFPFLLSNGNLIEEGELPENRHFAVWEDPFRKPAYLFALVAGNFDMLEDSFTTMSGREIPLRIYVDPGDAKYAEYAMDSLKRAMKWDEDVFGREYDLELFMIVAVRDFNFGAMENKGLNIFNSSVLLADAQIATDADFERIEGVVAHEYFHNWTGNRITCRDWFQLCLKEGLTVFRDQEFSADQRGGAIKRIKDVRTLRARQFPEDAGPLAHSVRPETYLTIDNFYTATVYEKGAELIRALKAILGDDGFAQGMDEYFNSCDGTSATMEQFLDCFARTSGRDLSGFLQWYRQAGTPRVKVEEHWDAEDGKLTLTFSQTTPDTPGQTDKEPVPIPLVTGLIGENGPVPVKAWGNAGETSDEVTLVLEEAQQSWSFGPYDERPVVSTLRRFSSPVILQQSRSNAERARLIAADPDWFTRWEEAQKFAKQNLLDMANDIVGGETPEPDSNLLEALGKVLADESLDPAFVALALQVPGEAELFQAMNNADPDAIRTARETLIHAFAGQYRELLETAQNQARPSGDFTPDSASAGRRALANQALAMLARLQDNKAQDTCLQAWLNATNMTDAMAALSALEASSSDEWESAMQDFYAKWQHNPLVVDKWFMMQAVAHRNADPATIAALCAHEAFDPLNPNRARSVYGAFATANLPAFHAVGGAGHDLLADGIITIDPKNPSVAARLAGAFESWRLLEPGRRATAKAAISRIRDSKDISKNSFEITSKQLG